ncbi:MAG TPA: thiamine pyrophosphate-dependent enzyme [Polyangiaceae bacterium]|jgi:pyruvate dehydrogenase E1 component alpha subunit/2-oxoisovalerate dehydrogenase E1 component alpha subunit
MDDAQVEPSSAIEPETKLALYRHMRRIRKLDERMLKLQREGRISFYGPALGQEATPVATALAIQPCDWVFPALRESSVMLVRGFPLVRYLAQLFATDLDVLKGRQMPSHMSAREVKQVSWSSAVGTQLPHAVGMACAARLRGDSAIAIAFLSDGATSVGDFHSALNFAGVFKAPCVFVCQNNQWAISVPLSRQTAQGVLALKATAYGLPGLRVDGNDALAVYSAVQQACQAARDGLGPTFIECVTCRMGPHSSSDDPSRYRQSSELDQWARRDPIQRLGAHLYQSGLFSPESDQLLEQAIDAELSSAIATVEAGAPPAVDSLFDDVYARLPWHLFEQRQELLARRGVVG